MKDIIHDIEEFDGKHCSNSDNGIDGDFPDEDEIAEYARMIKATPEPVHRI